MVQRHAFRPEALRYRHTVTILDASRVLFLRNARDIDMFTRRYGRDLSANIELLQDTETPELLRAGTGMIFPRSSGGFSNYIMWAQVAERHSGIVVDPYSRARSRTYLWYYGWNCAGGCIWDTGIISLGPARADV